MSREALPSITRRQTRQIHVGHFAVGGGAPITVQAMTTTPTRDAEATLEQIGLLARAGCDIVRVAVPGPEDARALPEIVKWSSIPVVADIHFSHRLALEALEAGIACLRLNPGNIGKREKVEEVVRQAAERRVPIRIGVNAGSLEKPLREKVESGELARHEAMVESALGHIRILEELGFYDTKVSLKASDVINTVRAYRLLAEKCDYPFHVGVTEAGPLQVSTILSSIGIGALLLDGMVDTLRVSLTGEITEQVKVGLALLRAVGERQDAPRLVSCPSCGRVSIDLVGITRQVEQILAGVPYPLHVAVMGCEVNGPGESRDGDLAVSGGGGRGMIYRDGEIIRRCSQEEIVPVFKEELDKLLQERYGARLEG